MTGQIHTDPKLVKFTLIQNRKIMIFDPDNEILSLEGQELAQLRLFRNRRHKSNRHSIFFHWFLFKDKATETTPKYNSYPDTPALSVCNDSGYFRTPQNITVLS